MREFIIVAIASLLVFVSGRSCHAEGVGDFVKISLVRDTVLVGEAPAIRIEAQAPADRTITVANLNKFKHNSMSSITILDETGEDVIWCPPYSTPSLADEVRPGDFIALAPGRGQKREFNALVAPNAEGKYVLYVEFHAGPGPQDVLSIKKEFDCIPIKASEIIEKIRFSMDNINMRRWYTGSSAEILHARIGGKDELVFQFVDETGVPRDARRLGPLEEDSRLTAVVEDVGGRGHTFELVAAYNVGGRIHGLRIGIPTGIIIGRLSLNEALPPRIVEENK